MKETTTTMSTPVSDHRKQDQVAVAGIEAARRAPRHHAVVQVEDLDRLPFEFHGNGTIVSRLSDRPSSLDARDLLGKDAA